MKIRIPRLILCVLLCAIPLSAIAQRSGGSGSQGKAVPRPPVAVRGEVFVGGYFYNPAWGPYPWWPRAVYAYRYSPIYDLRASVRVMVTPRATGVYVDGFYAGIVDDFDGTLQRLHLTPGGHEVVLYLAGYRTQRHSLYLAPASSMTLHAALVLLPPGEVSERPTFALPVPLPPHGSFREPRRPAFLPAPVIVRATPIDAFGTLDLRVQPAGARVAIDDRVWSSSDPQHVVVDLAAGKHQLKVSADGYQTYSAEIVIRDDEVTTLNVSLTKGGK